MEGDSRLLREVLARLWPVTGKAEVSGSEIGAEQIDRQVTTEAILQKLGVLSRTAGYQKAEGRAIDDQARSDVTT